MDQLFTILTLGQIYIPLFIEQNGIPLYPRGFPWKYRNSSAFNLKKKIESY